MGAPELGEGSGSDREQKGGCFLAGAAKKI
jgi:hypothetical protein